MRGCAGGPDGRSTPASICDARLDARCGAVVRLYARPFGSLPACANRCSIKSGRETQPLVQRSQSGLRRRRLTAAPGRGTLSPALAAAPTGAALSRQEIVGRDFGALPQRAGAEIHFHKAAIRAFVRDRFGPRPYPSIAWCDRTISWLRFERPTPCGSRRGRNVTANGRDGGGAQSKRWFCQPRGGAATAIP